MYKPSLLRGFFGLLSRTVPLPTSRLAATLFSYPHGQSASGRREAQWLEAAVPFDLVCGDRRLAAWSWGEGPTVLLHHGWCGRGSQMGALAAPLVAAGYSVVAYDAPAHGRSPGRFTNGIELARTIHQAARKLDRLHGIVAHSLGCLATGYAMRWGMPVSRLVFVSPPADMLTYTRLFIEALGFSDRVHDLMLEHFAHKLDMKWEELSAGPMAEADRRARGRQTPLLVVHDRTDRQAPWEHGQRYHEVWEGSRLMLTDGLGHRRILRDADTIHRIVDFLGDRTD